MTTHRDGHRLVFGAFFRNAVVVRYLGGAEGQVCVRESEGVYAGDHVSSVVTSSSCML